MLSPETERSEETVCDLKYLHEMMGGKSHLIVGIIDAFLIQIPDELQAIKSAIEKIDFPTIKNYSHTMKSSVSIVGIASLVPVLQQMEGLGGEAHSIEIIEHLYRTLSTVCKKALEELETEKKKYI